MTMTLLIAPLIGIASALLTIVLTPTLQHYFWRRQRHAEQQLAIIEEVNTLAAELHSLLIEPEDLDGDRQAQLYVRLVRTRNNLIGLFSDQACQRFLRLDQALGQGLFLPESCTPERRHEVNMELFTAHQSTLITLYHDMGIPPPPPAQWLREHAWQPFRRHIHRGLIPVMVQWLREHAWQPLGLRVWDHPLQYWHERSWPALQRWGAQVRTRIRRS